MSDVALQIVHLSKRFQLGRAFSSLMMREALERWLLHPLPSWRKRKEWQISHPTHMWALNDLHFTIQRGEAVGLIGMNGAGKSVLLKILARITHPTRGYAEVYGRVGALLEVGTGFHPEMTGRQNIYLSGVMLGINKAAIDEKFAGIVDFAGIGDFLDTPVKRYSSGMAVRLGFAVAIHMDQEILLIDEVLSIADELFKQQCVQKLKELIDQGRTLLIVSHQHELVRALCSRTLFLQNGMMQFDGSTAEAIARYDMMRKQCEPPARGTLA